MSELLIKGLDASSSGGGCIWGQSALWDLCKETYAKSQRTRERPAWTIVPLRSRRPHL